MAKARARATGGASALEARDGQVPSALRKSCGMRSAVACCVMFCTLTLALITAVCGASLVCAAFEVNCVAATAVCSLALPCPASTPTPSLTVHPLPLLDLCQICSLRGRKWHAFRHHAYLILRHRIVQHGFCSGCYGRTLVLHPAGVWSECHPCDCWTIFKLFSVFDIDVRITIMWSSKTDVCGKITYVRKTDGVLLPRISMYPSPYVVPLFGSMPF